jgi:hypothetical protein
MFYCLLASVQYCIEQYICYLSTDWVMETGLVVWYLLQVNTIEQVTDSASVLVSGSSLFWKWVLFYYRAKYFEITKNIVSILYHLKPRVGTTYLCGNSVVWWQHKYCIKQVINVNMTNIVLFIKKFPICRWYFDSYSEFTTYQCHASRGINNQ